MTDAYLKQKHILNTFKAPTDIDDSFDDLKTILDPYSEFELTPIGKFTFDLPESNLPSDMYAYQNKVMALWQQYYTLYAYKKVSEVQSASGKLLISTPSVKDFIAADSSDYVALPKAAVRSGSYYDLDPNYEQDVHARLINSKGHTMTTTVDLDTQQNAQQKFLSATSGIGNYSKHKKFTRLTKLEGSTTKSNQSITNSQTAYAYVAGNRTEDTTDAWKNFGLPIIKWHDKKLGQSMKEYSDNIYSAGADPEWYSASREALYTYAGTKIGLSPTSEGRTWLTGWLIGGDSSVGHKLYNGNISVPRGTEKKRLKKIGTSTVLKSYAYPMLTSAEASTERLIEGSKTRGVAYSFEQLANALKMSSRRYNHSLHNGEELWYGNAQYLIIDPNEAAPAFEATTTITGPDMTGYGRRMSFQSTGWKAYTDASWISEDDPVTALTYYICPGDQVDYKAAYNNWLDATKTAGASDAGERKTLDTRTSPISPKNDAGVSYTRLTNAFRRTPSEWLIACGADLIANNFEIAMVFHDSQTDVGKSQSSIKSFFVRTGKITLPMVTTKTKRFGYLGTSIEKLQSTVEKNHIASLQVDLDSKLYVLEALDQMRGQTSFFKDNMRDNAKMRSADASSVKGVPVVNVGRAASERYRAAVQLQNGTMSSAWQWGTASALTDQKQQMDIVVSLNSIPPVLIESDTHPAIPTRVYTFENVRFLGSGDSLQFTSDASPLTASLDFTFARSYLL